MLTSVKIRNFKCFQEVEVELGNTVVFIGPNNSGKTTALQGLALWETGLRRWNEKRGTGKKTPEKRPGVTINRRDLLALPIPDANLLWKDLHVRDVIKVDGKQQTKNIRVDIVVTGVSEEKEWRCGFEFDYANDESFYCRPLRLDEGKSPERMAIPEEALDVNLAFLPPMSGLAANETRLDPGAINVRLGEGRTAEVLRNLCSQVISGENGRSKWSDICDQIRTSFGVSLDEPKYLPERGEITMTYKSPSGTKLDLSCSGRGLQQTLLLLAHMAVNPRSVLLLDEPDAHLEILRQRQIYQLLSDTARQYGSQIIAASHSEIILNEAADRDVVVAFLGQPHRIDDRGSQLVKSLKEIGFDQYYQAEQKGWVLYLEGSTDLAILKGFAQTLGHGVAKILERPFVHYVQNLPQQANKHFHGLKEAKPNLVGLALYDSLDRKLDTVPDLVQITWTKREIENYICQRDVLLRWAKSGVLGDGTVPPLIASNWEDTMTQCITEIEEAMEKLRKGSPWEPSTKVTDDFLNPLFEAFFEKVGLPNLLRKTDYHILVSHLTKDDIDPEVSQVLDRILETHEKSKPVG